MSWAVVTGASRGIGLEMVRALAAREPNLHFLLIARNEEDLKQVHAELREKKVAAEKLVLDLTKPGAAQTIEEKIRKSGYAVRHLINNAGFGWWGRFDEQKINNIEDMIALNITTLTTLCRRIIPLMETDGHVVNIASSAGFAPMGGFAVYAATKAYVLSFSLALDAEIRRTREIKVSVVCPGPVETNFMERAEVPEGKVFSKTFREKPEATARRAIRGAARGRRLILTGFLGRVFRLVAWAAPRRIVTRVLMSNLPARD